MTIRNLVVTNIISNFKLNILAMKLKDFFIKFVDEQNCKAYFKQQREAVGIVCRQCGSVCHYWIERENRWRCKDCKQPTGLKTGTVMENSNLSYRVWLWALYLMSLTKKGFSALEMQRLIGHKRYEPIWLLMQKIRISMGHRDAQYALEGFIEMDEGFFEGQRKKNDEGLIVNPVKELDRQVKAIVAVSTTPASIDKQKQHRPNTKAGYLKMNVVASLNKIEVTYEAQKMIKKSATVMTDGKRCYRGLQDICKMHKEVIVKDKTEVSKVFPWVHIAISNAKKKLLGLHHQIKDTYMQNYLSEFCYKFNRRYFGGKLFDRLLIATLSNAWYES
jgi:hypothetical protein